MKIDYITITRKRCMSRRGSIEARHNNTEESVFIYKRKSNVFTTKYSIGTSRYIGILAKYYKIIIKQNWLLCSLLRSKLTQLKQNCHLTGTDQNNCTDYNHGKRNVLDRCSLRPYQC